MSLRDKLKQERGVRTYVTMPHAVLGEVKIRSLTEREYQSGYANWFQDEKGAAIPGRAVYGNVKLIQMCLLDPADDSQIYTDSLEDLDELVDQREDITKVLFDACWQHNRPALPKNG